MTTIHPEVLAKLRQYDTPTICNLIELFEVRPRHTGYMDARIRACYPELPPMVGFAATAAFRASAPLRQGESYGSLEAQIERFGELSGPPVVVFQDLDDPSVAATFGEIMCTAYKAFGAVGLITSGTGRDLDQVRALKFPAFTNGACCSHGYVTILHVHAPVHVGGIAVYPDDLLHGDCNGVTTIPREIASELAEIADDFVGAEGVILDTLRSGTPSVARLREARAESHALIARLRARVSRRK
ncbi:MAG: RraA family protein [Anaerolineae bacterium]|nr:RraA family protein [Anaerolineae bacterium]